MPRTTAGTARQLIKRSTFNNALKVMRIASAELRQSRATERQWYPTHRDWAVRVYDRILRKLHWAPLPLRKSVVSVRLRGLEQPFSIRLGSSDLQLHQTIRFRGEYDPLFAHAEELGPVRTILDLGANAGYTVRLWRERFPGCRVIAVEPSSANLELCRRNVRMIGAEQDVALVEACAAAQDGQAWLDVSGAEHHFHVTNSDHGRCLQVQSMTMPQILRQAQVPADVPIDLLKCDVQGAERELFAGCGPWIGQVRNMVVELHGDYSKEAFLADLDQAGWRHRRCIAHRTDDLWVMFLWGAPQGPADNPQRSGA